MGERTRLAHADPVLVGSTSLANGLICVRAEAYHARLARKAIRPHGGTGAWGAKQAVLAVRARLPGRTRVLLTSRKFVEGHRFASFGNKRAKRRVEDLKGNYIFSVDMVPLKVLQAPICQSNNIIHSPTISSTHEPCMGGCG